MKELKIQEFTELTEPTMATLLQLETGIFAEPLTHEILDRELKAKTSLCILISYYDNEPVGYKIGFEYASDHEYFYSWNGGVLPAYRRQGIAQQLMKRQHEIAKAKGYKFIRTQTKNKYRDMLILNIRSGFDVTGVYKKLREKHHGIILEKEL